MNTSAGDMSSPSNTSDTTDYPIPKGGSHIVECLPYWPSVSRCRPSEDKTDLVPIYSI